MKDPEFHDLMRMDTGHWPRCLLWHGWLQMLSGVNVASPFSRYSSGLIAEWGPSDEFDHAGPASSLPITLLSGRMVALSLIGLLVFHLQVLGSFLFLLGIAGVAVSGSMLMIFVLVVFDVLVGVSALFLGPLQSVQRAEMWRCYFKLCSLLLLFI